MAQPPLPVNAIPVTNSVWSPLDTVKDAAESLGISNLSNDAASVLAMDIEYRIFQITEQALKFMRHSKRKKLLTKDINNALKVLNIEPLYGYGNNIGNVNGKSLEFKQALVGPGQTLYYINDSQVDFEKMINTPLPKIPRLVTFTAHWLAVEGVQPSIPQNPTLNEIKAIPAAERGSIQNLVLNSSSVLDEAELQKESLLNNKSSTSTAAANATSNNRNINGSGSGNNTVDSSGNVQIKPLIKHVISKELLHYFDKIIKVLVSSPSSNSEYESLKTAVLTSLKSDPGLHQLVPYFIQFISETITNNLQDISLLHIMLESVYSLLMNDNIYLDPYIHSLLPCILTLLLAKKMGRLTGNLDNLDNEVIDTYLDEVSAIREFAASLLNHILKEYGSNYNTLKPRVARTLLKAFLQSSISNEAKSEKLEKEEDLNSSLEKSYSKNLLRNFGSYYGAIIGFKQLGLEIIRLNLLGNLKLWSEFVYFKNENDVDSENDSKMQDADADEKQYDSITKIVEKERKALIEAVISALALLKDEIKVKKELESSVNIDKSEDQIDAKKQELLAKLKERIGEGFANEFFKRDDFIDISESIFFGEI